MLVHETISVIPRQRRMITGHLSSLEKKQTVSHLGAEWVDSFGWAEPNGLTRRKELDMPSLEPTNADEELLLLQCLLQAELCIVISYFFLLLQ